jgi:hypothetical protein
MIEATEEQIRDELKVKFDDVKRQGFALKDSHFENGVSLHSSQYYFAKRYFQDAKNCEKLADLMCSRLVNSVELKRATTLVGYRNYSALLLNKVIMKLGAMRTDRKYAEFKGIKYVGKHNYAILEREGESFTWQYRPDLNENLLIVLPITCTCTTFFKIRRFLQSYWENEPGKPNIHVRKDFINVFLILDNSLSDPDIVRRYNNRVKEPPPEISDSPIIDKLQSIYSPFNWNEIKSDRINISTKKAEEGGDAPYTAHPLVRLYSELFLPEDCPNCYPEKDGQKEFPLIPTHDNYETPNLIFGFPNFLETTNKRSFIKTFVSGEKTHHIQLRGNISVEGSIYSSFIRGNAFYKKNSDSILDFFDEEIAKHLDAPKSVDDKAAAQPGEPDRGDIKIAAPPDEPERTDNKIVFITCENKHSSGFLEDISRKSALKGRSVIILRFLPTNEFIDNFISLHSKLIVDPDTKVIYFEEVMSAGKTFKLISNYIKHARAGNVIPVGPTPENSTHGFDLALTLVDRMLPYTKIEIMKKLLSEKNPRPENNLIAYFKLNVPILTASHMEDGSEMRKKQLEEIIERSNLDSFKVTIGKRIIKRSPIQLPELYEKQLPEKTLDYFPFGRLNDESDFERFHTYKPYFKRERIDLLHLHVVHELNNVLSRPKYQGAAYFETETYKLNPGAFIEELVSEVQAILADDLTKYFINPKLISGDKDKDDNLRERDREIENDIVHDIVVKSLSQPRFIYYQNIYRPIFHYCIGKLGDLIDGLPGGQITKFPMFREIKFYLRRSVDLNSNFMVSERFIKFVEGISNIDYIDQSIRKRTKIGERFDRTFQATTPELTEFKNATLNNIRYRISEITSFFPTLHYYYKELLLKNPARPLKLEALINDPSVLPNELRNRNDPHNKVEDLITNSYFHFTDILRTENVDPLSELVRLHKKNIIQSDEEVAECEKKIAGTAEQAEKEEASRIIGELEKSIGDPETIHKNYFQQLRNDPIIFNARKLLKRSLHREQFKDIELSVSHALATVGILERKRKSNYDKKSLNAELKEILDSSLNILETGENASPLNYALFVEYRKNPKSNDGLSEFYSYVKDEHEKAPSRIRLSNDGLIYNLLNGLYGEQDIDFGPRAEAQGKLEKEETLIAGLKLENDRYVSFKNDYFIKDKEKGQHTTFARMYKNDLFNEEVGISFLNDATMVLAIRLANFISPERKGEEYSLEGRAVLLITSSADCNTSNFLSFMSSEKIRLFLLIKQDLLAYLQRQVDNEVFLNHIETQDEVLFRSRLRHGLLNYRNEQTAQIMDIEDYFDSKASDLMENIRDNFDTIEIIEGAIGGQLEDENIGDPLSTLALTKDMFERIVRLLLRSTRLGEREIEFTDISISGLTSESLMVHTSLIRVVIPELIINMKKHCPRKGRKNLSVNFDADNSVFVFSNRKGKSKSKSGKAGKGLEMCNGILKKLNLPPIQKIEKDDIYSFSLKVK